MATTIEGVKFFTVLEVAEALRITPATIRRYVKSGRLKGVRVGKPVLITEKSLKEFLGVEAKN